MELISRRGPSRDHSSILRLKISGLVGWLWRMFPLYPKKNTDRFILGALLKRVVVGFGFNRDDSHINGLFRKLIEEHEKALFWVVPSGKTTEQLKSELLEKLRLAESCRARLHPVVVNPDTRLVNGEFWIDVIAKQYEGTSERPVH